MFRKNYFTILLMPALLAAGSIAASAQSTAPVSGSVVLTKADGTKEPLQGAVVDAIRTDSGGKLSTKTNKKGEFSFAGLQLGGVYSLSVSAPNVAPTYLPNVKAGFDKIVINVSPGDGRKLTDAEVRSPASTSTTTPPPQQPAKTELTEEEKKKQEEEEKKIAAVTESNNKIVSQNTIVQTSLKAGNEAYNAKNYDLAVAEYDKGYQANKTFVGSAPALLNNKGLALGERGREASNQSVKSTDATAKAAANAKATKDFGDAIEAFNTSWMILKNAPVTEGANKANYDTNKKQALEYARTVIRYMIVTEKVDSTKISAISMLLTEYLAAETDAAKKAEAEAFLGDIYRISNDCSSAITEYKKTLERSPNNVDALGYLGLCQVNTGFNADATINEAAMQEAINNLQKFIDVAPANHKLKNDVTAQIDGLKKLNIKPTKGGGKKKG